MKPFLPLRMALAAAFVSLISAPAAAAVGPWISAESMQFRLVASAGENGGPPVAAVEMRLDAGWKTYWRTPGAGGLPTQFDFAASRNLADARVSYPTPRRYSDGYGATNVYEGRVVFPVAMTAEVPTAPVTVHVVIDLGICETICIPLTLEASLTMAPGDVDADALAIVADGLAMLPTAPIPGAFEVTGATRVGGDEATAHFQAEAIVPEAFGAVLFVEGPDGWYVTPPEEIGRDGNRLTFAFDLERINAERPFADMPLTFTLASERGAIEQTIVVP